MEIFEVQNDEVHGIFENFIMDKFAEITIQ